MLRRTRLLPALLLSSIGLLQPVAAPAAPQTLTVDIDGMDLERALLRVARLSGREIVFSADLVAGHKAPRMTGRFTAEEAVRRLLVGTGLSIRIDAGTIVVVRAQPDEKSSQSADIVVTGSRIRGAQAYAPLTVLGRDALRRQGVNDLGDAIRRLPQNFNGGQSPVVGVGSEDYGSDNLNSASAINLRGLGPDATLTLLNGHRIAYDGVVEGVDISAIPLAAIDRIEIVADGASAIYGSDAVAGVANVVLRRDATGFYTSARVGGTTDGGDRQQQYELVTGGRWGGGGVILAGSYDTNTAITADQRSFTRDFGSSSVIYPRMRHFGGIASAHQEIGSAIDASVDILFSKRRSFSAFPFPGLPDYLAGGIDRHPSTTNFAVAPTIVFKLAPRWAATLNVTYGLDDTRYHTRYFDAGAVSLDFRGTYDNRSLGAEGSLEGPLLSLPGGDARLALGAGYRRASLSSVSSGSSPRPVPLTGHRESLYGFGELNLPFVGSANTRPGVDRLSVDLAGRFEHYPSIGDVFTPKVGALYAPVRALEIRATWGRSFKAPTLFQLYEAPNAYLDSAAAFGGADYPATATTIYSYGGNPALGPQKATTWSAGLVLKPFEDERLRLEASYFDTRYRDRIVAPITSGSTALSDPRLTGLVIFDPNQDQVAAVVDAAALGLLNYTGEPFDPSRVVAIIDDHNRNIATQRLHGVDIAATARIPLSGGLALSLSASGTYLDSEEQLLPGAPAIQLAGQLFYPPHARVQAGGTISNKRLAIGGFLNFTGGSRDERFAPVTRVHGQTTVDLSARYEVPAASGPLRGVSFLAAVVNLSNSKPDRIRNPGLYGTPFDSTNFSPVGRSLSLTVAKQW